MKNIHGRSFYGYFTYNIVLLEIDHLMLDFRDNLLVY